MTTILITGSHGYLGAKLADYLNQNCLFNLKLGSSRPSSNEVRFLLEDSSNYDEITKNVDCVIHLAGANFEISQKDLNTAIKLNQNATLSLLKSSEKNHVKLFVYVSTAHVYKTPLSGVLNEHTEIQPKSNYAISKAKAEESLKLQRHQTKISILRLANVVGPPLTKNNCDWNLLVNSICRDIFLTKQITLRTNGMGIRNFLAIGDFVESVEYILSNSNLFPDYDIINLGGNRNYKVIEIVQMIAEEYEKIFKQKIPITLGSQVDPSTEDFSYSIEKARKYNLKTDGNIRDEIKDMLLFCEKNFSNA